MLCAITNSVKACAPKSIRLVILFLILLTSGITSGQNTDSILKANHSPKKASIMSACLPGLGQAYNKKYWKIPIIYAAAGGVAYGVIFNNHYYKIFRDAFVYRTDTSAATVDDYPGYSTDGLLLLRNYYRRNLELCYIIGGAVYALNILDAAVDAHLFKFDINDDLSMQIHPVWIAARDKAFAGLSFSFTFGKTY